MIYPSIQHILTEHLLYTRDILMDNEGRVENMTFGLHGDQILVEEMNDTQMNQ